MTYIIADHIGLAYLQRMSTSADTLAAAQATAAKLAKQYGCRVYVLGVVGVVECPAIEPQWVQPMVGA